MAEPSNSSQALPINADNAEDILDVNNVEKMDLAKLFTSIQDPTTPHGVRGPDWILDECKTLFSRDYECKLIDNLDNNIPGIHPKVIIVPVAENVTASSREKMNFEVCQYLKQEQESTSSGHRRFPCPVILFNGKYICRSRYPHVLKHRLNEQNAEVSSSNEPERPRNRFSELCDANAETLKYEFARKDVEFLKNIDVTRIVDLSNSDECDFRSDIMITETLRNFYEPFEISYMPYPALQEFDAALKPTVEITQQTVLNFLQKLIEGRGGILIQTFNGRFRASLFTSLLRLSLWADGLIHRSLTMPQVAFLSVGYDWYLFGGHTGANPEVLGKMMMLFFSFLTVISTDTFSMTRMMQNQNIDTTEFPRFQASRRDYLRVMGIHLMQCYSDTAKYLALKKASAD